MCGLIRYLNNPVDKVRGRVADRVLFPGNTMHEAVRAVQDIQGEFLESVDENSNAWGQYIDPPSNRDHVGIYGTSSGIKVLSLGRQQYSRRIEEALDWLIEQQWENEDSETVSKGFRTMTFKFVYLSIALDASGECQLDSGEHWEKKFTTYCQELWDRKTAWGWGEFWIDSNNCNPPCNDATALVFSVISRCDSVRQMPEFDTELENFVERVIADIRGEPNETINQPAALVDAALAVYALGVYKQSGDVNADWVEDKLSDLVGIVGELTEPAELDTQSFDFRLFFPQVEDVGGEHGNISSDFFIHIVYPLVGLSLITAGEKYVARRYRLVRKIAKGYTEEIQDSDVFISENTDEAAHVDQMWIASCLDAYTQKVDRTEVPLTSLTSSIISMSAVGHGVILLSIAVLLAGAFVVKSIDSPSWLWFVEWLLLILAGVIFKEVYEHKIRGIVRTIKQYNIS